MTNWTEDQPAVNFLRRLVATYFPEVGLHWDAMATVRSRTRTFRDHSLHGVGGYKARTTESGGFSLHSEGRAADIYVKVTNPLLKSIGDGLFSTLIAHAATIGLEEVIWNHQMWSASVPRIHAIPAGKNMHEDHVHVGFSRAGSQRQSVVLVPALAAVQSAVNAAFPWAHP